MIYLHEEPDGRLVEYRRYWPQGRDGILYIDRLSDGDWKTVQKIARKRGWGKPGASWMPGVDDLEA